MPNQQNNMEITKATIVLNKNNADFVMLRTNKPSSMPGVTSENLSIMFYAAYDTGEQYVKENFHEIPIEIIPRIS